MDLGSCQTVIICGGSFDPPHNGHVELPKHVMKAIGADAVAYVPAGVQPFKQDGRQTAPEHRLAMLRLALADEPWAIVLTDEIDRAGDGPGYTVDTLEGLRQRLGSDVTMRLLIGSDLIRDFGKWKNPDRIIELAEPLVVIREPDTIDTLDSEWADRVVEVPRMKLSSTMVRQTMCAGQPIGGMVCSAVEDYLREHGLYP